MIITRTREEVENDLAEAMASYVIWWIEQFERDEEGDDDE
jgi:hypothetical protein